MLNAPQIGSITADETRKLSVSFVNRLDSGETLTGTPTVTVSPSGPTLGTTAINGSSITVNGRTATAGQAIQFTITDCTAGSTYQLTVTASTTADQVLQGIVIVDCPS